MLPPQTQGRSLPQQSQSVGRNGILSALSAADLGLLEPHLEMVTLKKDMVLEECDGPIEHVFFPTAGLGSVLACGPNGDRLEAGMFGREGMSGTAISMGAECSPLTTVMQVAGSGLRIEADALRQAIEDSRELHKVLLRFGQALAIQTTYTALANMTHPVEVRLARWLLMADDRLGSDQIHLTHDYLSVMLGVRRPSVTTALHILEGNKLIRGTRGVITIRDRAGLEEFADGSYGKPEAEYGRLVGGFFN